MEKFGLDIEDIEKIQSVFSKYKSVNKVLIYGSRAMGTYRPSSDIDLSLLGADIDLSLQLQIESDLDDLMLPYKFDISLFDKISNQEFLDHIKRVGLEFYSKEDIYTST